MGVHPTRKLSKRKGPVRAEQVRKILFEANRGCSYNITRHIGTRCLLPKPIIGKTGLTPPLRPSPSPREPPISSLDLYNSDRDTDLIFELTSDLLCKRDQSSKFQSFIYSHRLRCMRSRTLIDAKPTAVETPQRNLLEEAEEYERQLRRQKMRENTALDSQDDEWASDTDV